MARRIMLIALAVMMMVMLAGCSMVTVNEERDGERAVAKVNGVEILKKDVVGQIKLYISNSGVTEDSSYYDTYFDMYADSVLEAEVTMELCRQYCKENGIELITEEQQTKIDEDIASMEDLAGTLAENNVNEEDYSSDEKYQAALEAMKQDYLAMYGLTDGTYRKTLENNAVTENVIAALTKDYDPSDEDIKAYYDRELEDQKKVIGEQLSSFTTFEDEGILLYMPEGVRYIKYVFVALDDEAVNAIDEAETEEKDSVREEKLAEIKATAEEALAAANEDFDAAIKKYCPEGDTMLGETALADGLRIYTGSTDFESEVISAANELKKVGDKSGLIATDKGYYILEMVGEEEAGEVAFDDIKDTLLEHMIEENEEDTFTTTTGEWLDEADVKYYKNRLN